MLPHIRNKASDAEISGEWEDYFLEIGSQCPNWECGGNWTFCTPIFNSVCTCLGSPETSALPSVRNSAHHLRVRKKRFGVAFRGSKVKIFFSQPTK